MYSKSVATGIPHPSLRGDADFFYVCLGHERKNTKQISAYIQWKPNKICNETAGRITVRQLREDKFSGYNIRVELKLKGYNPSRISQLLRNTVSHRRKRS